MTADDLVAALVLEDGQRWGDAAAPFQWDDLAAVFDPDGVLWHFLTRPRGGSKSTDLAAMLLAWGVVEAPAAARGYVVATDRDQGSFAVLDAIAGLIRRTEELRGLVDIQSTRVVFASGATVEVLSADGASAWGLRPAFVVADEVAQWPDTRNARTLWTALVSSLGKVPGCRFVVLTSAGEPSHWSRKILIGAKESPRWRVAEVPGPLPWVDPAYLTEQRRMLRESEYRRLHLNEWCEGEDILVTEADLAACTRASDEALEPVTGTRYVLTVDLGLTNDRAIAVVAHAEPITDERGSRRRVIVDRIQKWRGTRRHPVDLTAVEEWLAETSRRYNRARAVVDPWQAAAVCQRLTRRGVVVTEWVFSATSVGRLANALYLDLRQHSLSLPNDPDLLEELARVRLKETTPGVVRLDHERGAHDDQAVAVGLACVTLAEQPDRKGLADTYMASDGPPTHTPDGTPLLSLMPGLVVAGDTSTGMNLDQAENGRTAASPFL